MKSTIALTILLTATLLAGTTIAATPKASACMPGSIGGVVKEVKKVGDKTVMSFKNSSLKITIPSNRPEARELAKVKPGTLHCVDEEEDI